MEEKKLVVCRKHWTRFIIPSLWVALFLGSWATEQTIDRWVFPWVILPAAAFLIVLYTILKYKTTYIMLTEKNIVVRQGILFRRVQVIPRIRVKGIQRGYTVPGRIFGYRTITVRCWGDKEPAFSFKHMTKVNEFASALTGRTDEEEKLLR